MRAAFERFFLRLLLLQHFTGDNHADRLTQGEGRGTYKRGNIGGCSMPVTRSVLLSRNKPKADKAAVEVSTDASETIEHLDDDAVRDHARQRMRDEQGR
ncbi:hypothetical protein JYG33_03430 [Alcaligenes sp. SORT26]|uniref:hypothetical protein n=1 Tax=Alcaligenes sp. SORT26 TaxID=2813780 RepID=UPI001A9FE1EE|nr:hypothetical protein [Alcaligenes sp. SORT26]QTC00533.1 hypothetical protein JYG33_03430 [Alcaligenes sp. SORT26]